MAGIALILKCLRPGYPLHDEQRDLTLFTPFGRRYNPYGPSSRPPTPCQPSAHALHSTCLALHMEERAMTHRRGWTEAALSTVERVPPLNHLRVGVRRGLLLGGLYGMLLFFAAGTALGSLNRGTAGALIGGLSSGAGGLVIGALIGMIVGPRLYYDASSAEISIRLDRDGELFHLGDVVRGHVIISARRTLQIDRGHVHFLCRGFRTFDALANGSDEPELVRDTVQYIAESVDTAPSRVVRGGTAVRYPFEFTLPEDGVPTHHGNVCAVRWTLHAVVEAQRLQPIRAHRELRVIATPPQVPRIAGEYRSIVSSDACQLILSLPEVLYIPGADIEAQVRVTPKRSLGVDEIRAVLLRIEHVPTGDDHIVYVAEWNPSSGLFRGERRDGGSVGTTYVWLESEAELARDVSLRMGESLSYSFTLQVPGAWRPTLRTAEGDVVWKVGVVVARPDAQDVRVFHEIIIHTETGAPPGSRVRRVSA